jgi:hypothetical protein
MNEVNTVPSHSFIEAGPRLGAERRAQNTTDVR